jgi:hypothetical protein
MPVDRPAARHRPLLAATCVALLACLAPASAAAVPALNWSGLLRIDDTTALTGVSCASASLCVAVDEAGHALASTDPAAGTTASWSHEEVDGKTTLTGISCSGSLCVAVDHEGHVLTSTDPAAGATASWSSREVDGKTPLTGISCPSTSLCVAVDHEGHVLASTNPAAGATASWSRQEVDGKTPLTGISCPSTSLCVAVDDEGSALASSEPTGGAAAWRPSPIDLAGDLVAVSCAPAPAGVCVAVDGEGDVLASGDPAPPSPTWSWTPAFGEPGFPTAVSCTAAGLCLSTDSGGGAFAGDDPTAAAPTWSFYGADPGTALKSVSCTAEGLCAAVDGAGHVLVAQTAPPAVVTGTASALAETAATVTGTVDPQDATLTACHFEYGFSEAYGQSAPCAATPVGGSAPQPVSAAFSGLAANTTYHFRLVAASASGTERAADGKFTTLAPPLPQPHPSIGGIPARGQQLTCKTGLGSAATSVSVSYAWLRNDATIAGASGATYLVSNADVSHHLQCRVTATNAAGSASGTSAFVTVPAGGLGSISESHVSAPRVSGSAVSVTVSCSPQAAGSCAFALRLTVVETSRHGHVVAVAARRAQRTTVTIGAGGARVGAGQHRTVTATLNATGRRLLARLHRLPARLSVRGTIVGALTAPLLSATVTMGGAGKASGGRASTRGGAAHRTPAHRGR